MATHFFYYTELRQITPAHWAQLEVPLLISILAIGGIRILTETLRSRLYIMPMSIAGKLIGVLVYMMIATRFKRKKLKACMVLNFIEPIGWFVAILVLIIGMVQGCAVAGCILSTVVVVMSAVLLLFQD